ncbi:uncharacterized protein TrAtP1_002331 [Trichoderma atroviride]|uniref:uncharacterized protein n=1 Tax=Hypocrea atroviridis TaxID=63577 RepID=UPI0033216CD0|nr:hypothetical protein TrAtP1_002331 [Trichoderma atroviride]
MSKETGAAKSKYKHRPTEKSFRPNHDRDAGHVGGQRAKKSQSRHRNTMFTRGEYDLYAVYGSQAGNFEK